MRVNRIYVVPVLVLTAGMVLWFFIGRAKGADVAGVTHIHAGNGAIQTYISTTGTVLPRNRLEVKPPVNGRVEQILVQEGDQVKAGQIMGWMSSTDRAALLDAARGKSDASLAYWKDVYKPIALVAPIDGQVIVATMQPGQTVTTADPVIVLSDILIFRAQVDETDIGKISTGQEALATLDAFADTKIKCRVAHIYYESKTVNNVTIYPVDLKAEDLPVFCRSGMNVSVDFKAQGKDNILILPADAVKKDREGYYVMVSVPGVKEPLRRAVSTGITDDVSIEIVSGLAPEDKVVVQRKKLVIIKSSTGTNPFVPARPGGGGRR